MLSVLFIVFEFLNDLNLIIKIFVLLTIVHFIKTHIQNKALGAVLMVFIGWFVLFEYWRFFGGVFVLYSLLMFGISAIIIDFFFVSSGGPAGGSEGMESPISSGLELMARQQMLEAARRRHRPRRPGM
jgi:hypothetical protein